MSRGPLVVPDGFKREAWMHVPPWLRDRYLVALDKDGDGSDAASDALSQCAVALNSLQTGEGTMPLLSVRQPFAAALLAGVKRAENRSWRPPEWNRWRPGDPNRPEARWYALHAGQQFFKFADEAAPTSDTSGTCDECGEENGSHNAMCESLPHDGPFSRGADNVPKAAGWREVRAAAEIRMRAEIWPSMPKWETLPRGALLGAIRVWYVADVQAEAGWLADDAAAPWIDFVTEGNQAWMVDERIALREPLACDGSLGIGRLDCVSADVIRAQYRLQRAAERQDSGENR